MNHSVAVCTQYRETRPGISSDFLLLELGDGNKVMRLDILGISNSHIEFFTLETTRLGHAPMDLLNLCRGSGTPLNAHIFTEGCIFLDERVILFVVFDADRPDGQSWGPWQS